jgi:hypothetical protein
MASVGVRRPGKQTMHAGHRAAGRFLQYSYWCDGHADSITERRGREWSPPPRLVRMVAETPPTCEPPASHFELAGAFPGTVPAFTTPALQASLIGTSGTFEGRGVFQPKPAPPPAISEGCKENSQFTVTDFQGTLLVQGAAFAPVALATFPGQPVDARLSVHFGPEPNKPVLTFRSAEPVSLGGVPIRSVQIVGGQIVFVK